MISLNFKSWQLLKTFQNTLQVTHRLDPAFFLLLLYKHVLIWSSKQPQEVSIFMITIYHQGNWPQAVQELCPGA